MIALRLVGLAVLTWVALLQAVAASPLPMAALWEALGALDGLQTLRPAAAMAEAPLPAGAAAAAWAGFAQAAVQEAQRRCDVLSAAFGSVVALMCELRMRIAEEEAAAAQEDVGAGADSTAGGGDALASPLKSQADVLALLGRARSVRTAASAGIKRPARLSASCLDLTDPSFMPRRRQGRRAGQLACCSAPAGGSGAAGGGGGVRCHFEGPTA